MNGTTQSGGSTTASSVPGQNVVVLQLPLTTSNALDVWNAGAANRTDPLVLDRLYTNNTQNNNYNTFNQFRVVVQGELFDMPAGPLKIAVGGEQMWQEQQFKLSGGNNTGPTTTGSGYRVFNFDRDIMSAFAEVAVPLVSPEWDIPALQPARSEPVGTLRRLLGRGRHHQSAIRHQLEYHGRLPRPCQLCRIVRGAADRGHW